MTRDKIKTQQSENYKNFGLAVLIIVGVIICFFIISAIAHFGFSHGIEDSKGVNSLAYETGFAIGKSTSKFLYYYFYSGMFFGNLFALVASLEKRNSFRLVLLHGILGWGYIIYYTITRKTIFTN
ncbi:hypothetical protein D9V96_004275 [Zobellia laminariae]|uniref:hypothetical protein n=1 Tax=Zobellia laminariae TaxID=248906 RepID=UPI0012D89674|nr:hypothetical protein [Zobellia laminariae]